MGERTGNKLAVYIENLGGIDSLDTILSPGITILAGENATNRSSFLRSIAAAMGGDKAATTVKTDADKGAVSLTVDGREARRKFSRTNGTVRRDGSPLTDESVLVDTYVSIFSTNPARVAVRDGGTNLREILMRGVDTSEIEAEIEALKQRKSALSSQIDQIERAQERLPAKENRRQSLSSKLADIEEKIQAVNTEIEEHKATVGEIEAAEKHLEKLEDQRQKLRDLESRINGTRTNIESLEAERESLQTKLEDMSVPEAKRRDLESEQRALQSQIDELQNTVTELSDLVSHNKSVLNDAEFISAFDTDDTVVSELDPAKKTVECWTCGSKVERSAIKSRIETLESLRSEKNQLLQDLKERHEHVERDLLELQERQQEKEKVEGELRETESAIEAERDSLERLEAEREQLRADITERQERVEDSAELRDSDLPAAYEQLSELEHERGQKESQLEQVESEIQDLRETIDTKEDIQSQLKQVKADLEEARGRVQRIENDVVTQFNEQMADLIEMLSYENISRVWLERIVGDRKQASEFELHIVRESADGTIYEDTVDTLSESEREIIGIMVAVAGYFVHDLAETLPIIMFDSVEAIDAERLENMLEYVSDFAPYIIAALLPEEASAIEKHTVHAPSFEAK